MMAKKQVGIPSKKPTAVEPPATGLGSPSQGIPPSAPAAAPRSRISVKPRGARRAAPAAAPRAKVAIKPRGSTSDAESTTPTAPHQQTGAPRPPPRRATRTSGNPLVVFFVVGLVIAGIAATGIWHGRRQAREQRMIRLAVEARQMAGAEALRLITGHADAAQSVQARVNPLREQVEADLRTVRGEGLRRATAERDRSIATIPVAAAPLRRDPSAPEGMPTREELEARRHRAAGLPPPAAGAADDPVADEIRALGDAFVEGADLIAENAAIAMDLQSFSDREWHALQREIRLAQARDRATNLEAREAAVEELVIGSREAFERLEDLSGRIARLRERHEQAERERREQEAAAHRAREQAELAAREQALAVTYRKQADELIAVHRYEDALEAAERQLEEFRSDSGRRAHQLTVDQCRELEQLKRFLIESLGTRLMSWGWTQTTPARDIIGADRGTLQLRGSTVEWSDVSIAQMARIIDHHLGDPRAPPSLITRFGIGAALFYHKAGQRDQVRAYVERAVSLQPSLQDRANRLMPRQE